MTSIVGLNYYIVFVDYCSPISWVYLLKNFVDVFLYLVVSIGNFHSIFHYLEVLQTGDTLDFF